jgi:hypothetical protein
VTVQLLSLTGIRLLISSLQSWHTAQGDTTILCPLTKLISSFLKAKAEETPPIHPTVAVRPISQN